uniref:Carboxylic ester hydrolase n=1 Tax=Magallana gigas TaxID=29159 RepID=K1QHR6_MAGGI
MVWFHGGAFVMGSSSFFDASNLSGFGNVVVVTANYRLGPIGFLATDDDTSKGNYGLWDQHMVIQWVHDNIAFFGGDPHRVTLFGESAGGASSFYQAMYPPNKGLIHRIISESGTAICPWAYGEKATVGRFAKFLGLKLNCSIATNSELLSCLRTKPYEDLISNAQVGTQEDEIYRPEWTPVVDNEFIKMLPPDNYLYPETMYADVRDALADLDLLLGVNDGDGGFITMVSLLPFVQSKVTHSYPAIDVVNNYVTNSMLTDRFGITLDSLADIMSFVYTNWSASETNDTYRQKLLDMTTDYQFFIPAYVSAQALVKLQAPERHTYKYLFTHRSPFGRPIPWVPGAAHGDELAYVFGFPSSMQTGPSFQNTLPSEEVFLAETIMTYWTNFAKTGDPNKPAAVPLVWPKFDNHSEYHLTLNTKLSIQNKMLATRTALWTELALKELKDVHNFHTQAINSITPKMHGVNQMS